MEQCASGGCRLGGWHRTSRDKMQCSWPVIYDIIRSDSSSSVVLVHKFKGYRVSGSVSVLRNRFVYHHRRSGCSRYVYSCICLSCFKLSIDHIPEIYDIGIITNTSLAVGDMSGKIEICSLSHRQCIDEISCIGIACSSHRHRYIR